MGKVTGRNAGSGRSARMTVDRSCTVHSSVEFAQILATNSINLLVNILSNVCVCVCVCVCIHIYILFILACVRAFVGACVRACLCL